MLSLSSFAGACQCHKIVYTIGLQSIVNIVGIESPNEIHCTYDSRYDWSIMILRYRAPRPTSMILGHAFSALDPLAPVPSAAPPGPGEASGLVGARSVPLPYCRGGDGGVARTGHHDNTACAIRRMENIEMDRSQRIASDSVMVTACLTCTTLIMTRQQFHPPFAFPRHVMRSCTSCKDGASRVPRRHSRSNSFPREIVHDANANDLFRAFPRIEPRILCGPHDKDRF